MKAFLQPGLKLPAGFPLRGRPPVWKIAGLQLPSILEKDDTGSETRAERITANPGTEDNHLLQNPSWNGLIVPRLFPRAATGLWSATTPMLCTQTHTYIHTCLHYHNVFPLSDLTFKNPWNVSVSSGGLSSQLYFIKLRCVSPANGI